MTISKSYALCCSVCQGEYFSKSDWLRHLSSDGHQVLARMECLEEWGERNLRKCCLAIFSSFPLTRGEGGGGADKVIRYLSKMSKDPTTFVTDFVVWEDRPFVGFVQFESRKKVMELLLPLKDSSKLLIDNQRVQVKWALDLSDLEWNAILPNGAINFSTTRTTSNVRGTAPPVTTPSLEASVRGNDTTLAVIDNQQEELNENDEQVPQVSSSDRPEVKNAVDRLNELAEERGWEEPVFQVLEPQLGSCRSNYLCVVWLNDEKYRPISGDAKTESEARLQAAQFCLEQLGSHSSVESKDDQVEVPTQNITATRKRQLELEPPSSQDSEDDQVLSERLARKRQRKYTQERRDQYLERLKIDPETAPEIGNENPILPLLELAKFHHWPAPKFKCTSRGKRENRKCSCRITLNGVEYSPDANTVFAGTYQGARALTAAYCLKRLAGDPNDNHNDNQQDPSILHHRLPASISGSSDSLQYQFWNIRKSVTIPDDEYDKVLQIVRALKVLFLQNDASTEVLMFRNWYLKLRNPTFSEHSELFFYVYRTRSPSDFPDTFSWVSEKTIWELFTMERGQNMFSVLEAAGSNDERRLDQRLGWKVLHKGIDTSFYLVAYQRFFMEARVCRLLEYMLTFDPRCHSLLTLAYHWTSANSVNVGQIDINSKIIHLNLPEPLTLEWLVMLFLCHRGIVPSPRDIQQRPHPFLKDRVTGIDLGFHADPEYAPKWLCSRRAADPTIPKGDADVSSEDFILSVLNLFQDFLQFCGNTLSNGTWILNTRDGEIISIAKFLTCEPNGQDTKCPSYWETKMSQMEFSELRTLQQQQQQRKVSSSEEMERGRKEGGATGVQYRINFKDWKLYIIHPFAFTRKFSISSDIKETLGLMRTGAEQLKEFLNMRRSNGIGAAMKRFGSLEKVLRVVTS